MKIQTQASSLSFLLAISSLQAFSPLSRSFARRQLQVTNPTFAGPSVLRASMDSAIPDPSENLTGSDEVQRLRVMAQQLREEAAELASEQAQKVAETAMKAFSKFDLNQDGTISVDELKAGLEKVTKKEIPEDRIELLLQRFDANGDGVLQMDEFVPVDKLRNQLDAIVRDEKAVALEEAKAMKEAEEAKQLQEMRMALVNEDEPTTTDKVVSVLPYLFPLLDSLQYAGPWVTSHPDNVFAQLAAVAFTLYRSIPLSGLLTFFALSSLSSNLSLNRLIRFNIQQAIFLDFALFIPGLIVGLLGAVGSGLGLPATGMATELLGDAVVVGTLATVIYAATTSILSGTPDQVPWISDAAKGRLITSDMFDKEGKLVGPSSGDEVDEHVTKDD